MLANKHMPRAHQDVKKECEQLAELCVCGFPLLSPTVTYRGATGQSKVVGKSDHAKVSRFLLYLAVFSYRHLESRSKFSRDLTFFIAELIGC